jgi:hypothetical protein
MEKECIYMEMVITMKENTSCIDCMFQMPVNCNDDYDDDKTHVEIKQFISAQKKNQYQTLIFPSNRVLHK